MLKSENIETERVQHVESHALDFHLVARRAHLLQGQHAARRAWSAKLGPHSPTPLPACQGPRYRRGMAEPIPRPSFRLDSTRPAPTSRPAGNLVYPFPRMEVGQSFTVPWAGQGTLRSAANQYGRRHGVRFTTRTEGDKIRIWRIE
jgi:hypothetical protein